MPRGSETDDEQLLSGPRVLVEGRGHGPVTHGTGLRAQKMTG